MKHLLGILLIVSLSHAEYIRDTVNEVVVDTSRNLTWQDNAGMHSTTRNWSDAITYCEGLNLAGKSDWRLPNINELFMLADRNKENPSLDETFLEYENTYYSSSTTVHLVPGDPVSEENWGVTFGYGASVQLGKSVVYYVRCVRTTGS